MEGRPSPAGQAVAQQATPGPQGYAMGLPIGWNSSTGPTTGQCLNYTIAPLSNNLQQTTFNSQNTANSTAEQINVSASVSLSFDLFQANDTFSFSDQWQSSTNSNNQYYNIYSLYRLNSTVDREQSFNGPGESGPRQLRQFQYALWQVSTCHRWRWAWSRRSASTTVPRRRRRSDDFQQARGGVWARQCVHGRGSRLRGHELHFLLHVQYDTVRRRNRSHAALHNAFSQVNAQGQAFYALCAQGDSEACTHIYVEYGTGDKRGFDRLQRSGHGPEHRDQPRPQLSPDLSTRRRRGDHAEPVTSHPPSIPRSRRTRCSRRIRGSWRKS